MSTWNAEHWILWYGFCYLFGLWFDPFGKLGDVLRSLRAAWVLTRRATVWLKVTDNHLTPEWVYRQRTGVVGTPLLWCVKCRRPVRFAVFMVPEEKREVVAICHNTAERVLIPLITPECITVFSPWTGKMRCEVSAIQTLLTARTTGIPDPNKWDDFWVFFQDALNIDTK